ncbi:hypothetical protein [Actinokineospora sp.]
MHDREFRALGGSIPALLVWRTKSFSLTILLGIGTPAVVRLAAG